MTRSRSGEDPKKISSRVTLDSREFKKPLEFSYFQLHCTDSRLGDTKKTRLARQILKTGLTLKMK